MYAIKNIVGILLAVLFISCSKEWKDHYNPTEKTINTNVWEAIQKDDNLSSFVQYVKKYHYDTLFLTDHTFTLFIPNNKAFAQFIDSATSTRLILNYNISEFFIQSENIQGKKKVQTLGKKFALFERTNNASSLDGIPLNFESPLYVNGKYFIMDMIAYPKLNLYEYISVNNPLLKKYIDSQDSIIVDKSKSRPLGFDTLGHTIYDTVAIIYNKFEAKFFPVSKESRFKTATLVFPKEADYNLALTTMAQKMQGGIYHDYSDIPLSWQNKILIPYLLERGVFENMVEPGEFILSPGQDTLKLKNIIGDSVAIDYSPSQKTLCSNGYAYNYSNFKVPDTLWAGITRFEAETLLRNIGLNRWTWKDGILVSGGSFAPMQVYAPKTASKDSILQVNFPPPNQFAGGYSVEFNIDHLWPRTYLMVVQTNMNYGGIYDVYVNDVLVKSIDYSDLHSTRGYPSVIQGAPSYRAKNAYISFDCWVNSLVEYGSARIKFVYRGPSSDPLVLYRALSIDYIDFKPY